MVSQHNISRVSEGGAIRQVHGVTSSMSLQQTQYNDFLQGEQTPMVGVMNKTLDFPNDDPWLDEDHTSDTQKFVTNMES